MDIRTGRIYFDTADIPPDVRPYTVEISGEKLTPLQRLRKRVGRNDRCPCGSGKKFKHCHLKRPGRGETPGG